MRSSMAAVVITKEYVCKRIITLHFELDDACKRSVYAFVSCATVYTTKEIHALKSLYPYTSKHIPITSFWSNSVLQLLLSTRSMIVKM